MKNLSKILAVFTVLGFAASAFGTTIVCTEKKPRKGGDHERFTITLDRDDQLTNFTDQNISGKTGKPTGGGAGYGPTGGRSKDKPLKPKYSNDDKTYHYAYQDEGDGDYPGPKENWFITIPKSGRGPGHVGTTYDSGDSGRDDYDVDCK